MRRPPPAFAALLAFGDAETTRFIAPWPTDSTHEPGLRAAVYVQDADGAWKRDEALALRRRDCLCVGAMDFFAASANDAQRCIDAYCQYNDDFLSDIDGEFAFALADSQHEKIILARDRLGLQSLYYSVDGDCLAVASNLAGLRHLRAAPPPIDVEYMADFLANNVSAMDACIEGGVRVLPPGQTLVFQRGAARRQAYWNLTPAPTPAASPNPAARLRELMAQAIRKRCPDTGKIVVQLSGGLDSSALLGFLREIAGPERLVAVTRTFAATYRDERRDELAYAQDAARHCGVPLLVVNEEITNPLPRLEEYFERMGNFSPNPYYAISGPLYQTIGELDAAAVFAGVGGDEGVSLPGEIVLPELLIQGRWPSLWRILGEFSRIYRHSRWKIFRHWLLPQLAPAWLDDWVKHLGAAEEARLSRLTLMHGDVWRAASGGKRKKYMLRHERTTAREIHAGVLGPLFIQTHEIICFFSRYYRLGFQHPFLDHELLAAVVSLPPEYFLIDGQHRGLFRRATEGYLPESIAKRRGKSPFSLPFPIYIRAAGDMIMDMCHTPNHPAWEYLDRRALAILSRRVLREEINHEIELAAVVVGKTVAMAMFLANRHRYWQNKNAVMPSPAAPRPAIHSR
ncbi:MAG: hypothetical protein LBU39_06525 [Desulfobulbaceae bacterium]|jgi:asparagine synthase (glutamine-hydrolysing)|nr:hypothetical protein [Desulfobulbaceae bacterium]